LRGRVAVRRTDCTGEDVAGVGCRAQDARRSRREERSRGVQIGRTSGRPNHGARDASVHRSCRPVRLGPTSRRCARAAPMSREVVVRVTRRFPTNRRRG
jgi:hypothetical protein